MKHHAAALACILLLTAPFSAQSESASDSSKVSQRQAARPIGEFTDPKGFRRKYYVVPADLSDAQLTALGRQLHAQEKNAWLWLLNSDEKAKLMMATVQRNSAGELSKDYPGQWVEQHTAAHSGLHFMPGGGRQWLLLKGPYSGTQLSTLPCLDKSCTR